MGQEFNPPQERYSHPSLDDQEGSSVCNDEDDQGQAWMLVDSDVCSEFSRTQTTVQEEMEQRDVDMLLQAILKPGTRVEDQHAADIFLNVLVTLSKAGVWQKNEKEWKLSSLSLASILSHGSRVLIEFEDLEVGDNYSKWLDNSQVNVESSVAETSDYHGLICDYDRRIATHGMQEIEPLELDSGRIRKCLQEIKPSSLSDIVQVGATHALGYCYSFYNLDLDYGDRGHYCSLGIDLAVGGEGNEHPISKERIERNGEHGHLYIGIYKKTKKMGMLVGLEQSAPGKKDQYGGTHDAWAQRKPKSVTGGGYFGEHKSTSPEDQILSQRGPGDYYDSLYVYLTRSQLVEIQRTYAELKKLQKENFEERIGELLRRPMTEYNLEASPAKRKKLNASPIPTSSTVLDEETEHAGFNSNAIVPSLDSSFQCVSEEEVNVGEEDSKPDLSLETQIKLTASQSNAIHSFYCHTRHRVIESGYLGERNARFGFLRMENGSLLTTVTCDTGEGLGESYIIDVIPKLLTRFSNELACEKLHTVLIPMVRRGYHFAAISYLPKIFSEPLRKAHIVLVHLDCKRKRLCIYDSQSKEVLSEGRKLIGLSYSDSLQGIADKHEFSYEPYFFSKQNDHETCAYFVFDYIKVVLKSSESEKIEEKLQKVVISSSTIGSRYNAIYARVEETIAAYSQFPNNARRLADLNIQNLVRNIIGSGNNFFSQTSTNFLDHLESYYVDNKLKSLKEVQETSSSQRSLPIPVSENSSASTSHDRRSASDSRDEESRRSKEGEGASLPPDDPNTGSRKFSLWEVIKSSIVKAVCTVRDRICRIKNLFSSLWGSNNKGTPSPLSEETRVVERDGNSFPSENSSAYETVLTTPSSNASNVIKPCEEKDRSVNSFLGH